KEAVKALAEARAQETYARKEDEIFEEMLGGGGGQEIGKSAVPETMQAAIAGVEAKLANGDYHDIPQLEAAVSENIGKALQRLNNAHRAEVNLRRALALFTQQFGDQTKEIGSIKKRLADALDDQAATRPSGDPEKQKKFEEAFA